MHTTYDTVTAKSVETSDQFAAELSALSKDEFTLVKRLIVSLEDGCSQEPSHGHLLGAP